MTFRLLYWASTNGELCDKRCALSRPYHERMIVWLPLSTDPASVLN